MGKLSFKFNKKTTITVVVVVVLLVGTVILGAFTQGWLSNILKPSATNSRQKFEDARDLRLQGKPGEAQQNVEEQLKDTSLSDTQRYALYRELGILAYDKKDYKTAVTNYEKAAAINETYEITQLLADAWHMAGNDAKAIEYYKKALKLIPQDSPVAATEKSIIEAHIKLLGGTL
jgi:tetratricopeptide (TPR) repeat protein